MEKYLQKWKKQSWLKLNIKNSSHGTPSPKFTSQVFGILSMSQYLITPDQNPSYQNYLAKKVLANPASIGINYPTVSVNDDTAVAADGEVLTKEYEKLNSVLDSLDSSSTSLLGTKRKSEDTDTTLGVGSQHECNSNQEEESPYDWSRQFDYATNHDYYYNHRTGASQWERPNGYIDSEVAFANTMLAQVDAGSYANPDPYAHKATFTSKTGKFSQAGPESYWDKVMPLFHKIKKFTKLY